MGYALASNDRCRSISNCFSFLHASILAKRVGHPLSYPPPFVNKFFRQYLASVGMKNDPTGLLCMGERNRDGEGVPKDIRNQAQHHQKMTFQDEYRRLLERYRVAFDEQCVWD